MKQEKKGLGISHSQSMDVLAIKTIEDMFGFPRGTDVKPKFKRKELSELWVTIEDDAQFSSSRAKCNAIQSSYIR